jgi:hypothetical protein
MAGVHRVGRIDVSDDPRFTRRLWTFERAGWGIRAALVPAACLGFLGPGLFSAVMRGGGLEPVQVRFERFIHLEAEGRLKVRVRVPATEIRPFVCPQGVP